jgi:hypothetical protein
MDLDPSDTPLSLGLELTMSPAERHLARLLDDFARRSPPVRVVTKSEYWHQRAIGWLLKIVTLGGQHTYLSNYVTTLGHSIYVPDDFARWSAARRCEILRHEAVHVAQFRRLGWIGMTIIYLFFPFPLFLAYGRARLEWEAYAETLRAVAELEGLAAARDRRLHDEIVQRFTGPDYGWMWPFPKAVRGWITSALDEIERSSVGTSAPRGPS